MTETGSSGWEEPNKRPVIVVIDDEVDALATIERDLERRFGRDYRIVAESSPETGMETLDSLSIDGSEVALIAASLEMQPISGPELLDVGRVLHRDARRVLLIPATGRGNIAAVESRPELRHALSLGQADRAIVKGWASPEEWFYPQIQDRLSDWAGSHLPRKESVRLIGHRWDPATHHMRELLDRNVIPYGYYEAESPEGRVMLEAAGAGAAALPVAIFERGFFLSRPSPADVAHAIEARTDPGDEVYDVVIIGAGPAGLASAVYATSEGLNTLVIEPSAPGGQAGTSTRIRNYLGFPQGASGKELTALAYEQAVNFGANFLFMREAVGLEQVDGHLRVHLEGCAPALARSVIVAIGVRYRRLPVPGLERLVGAGVYYGSAAVEAPGMTGGEVYVVGGANSAGQAAVYLSRYASHVHLLVRSGSLEKDMSRYLIEQIRATGNIAVHYRHQVIDASGEYQLRTLTIEDFVTGEHREVVADGLFLLIGAETSSNWLESTLQMDDRGYILTGRDVSPSFWPLKRRTYPFETSMPGVFSVGDARYRSVKRVAAAVGEGSVAISSVRHFLTDQS